MPERPTVAEVNAEMDRWRAQYAQGLITKEELDAELTWLIQHPSSGWCDEHNRYHCPAEVN